MAERGDDLSVPGRHSILACYLLLVAVYLFYLPYAEFVIDGWWVFHKFEQARRQGAQEEWALAWAIPQNRLWGIFRSNWLSLLAVYGLYQAAGTHPAVYFLVGLGLHAAVGYLLYLTLVRLGFEHRLSFLAGALFLFLPTVHNQLFWCTGFGPYLLSAFWFLIYLRSVAGTILLGKLRAKAALVQCSTLTLALFSTDQVFGLLAGAALWLAICRRSKPGLGSAVLAWATIGTASSLYLRFVNRGVLGGTIGKYFHFAPAQVLFNVRRIWADYQRMTGFGDGFFDISHVGWTGLAAVAAGLLVYWQLRTTSRQRTSLPLVALLGAGLWVMGYGPVWLLQWRELRYDYLPSLGLAVLLAAACIRLFSGAPPLLAVGAGLLTAWSAATVLADMQQGWQPQSGNLRAIKQRLQELQGLRRGDIVVISNTPMQIGTAQHFAMILSYCSTPFVELTTGVQGLEVGREILDDPGKLGLQHVDFVRELRLDDLQRTHVLVSDGAAACTIRTRLAREVGHDRFELYPLKGLRVLGSPGRTYSRDELQEFEPDLYFPHRHLH